MEKEGGLKRTLGYKAILLITINSIMGTGIFFLPAVGAAASGPASIIAWLIISVIAIYTSMCFAELTSMFPKSGGIYEFAKQAFGRSISFFIGWGTLIAGYITIAMLIVGAINYILPVTGGTTGTLYTIFFASIFIILFNYITYRGMQTSATMLIAFAFITLGTLFALIIPGFFNGNVSNLTPFFTSVSPWSSVFLTIFLVAETFFGWETATFLAGETKNGERVVPKALVIATIAIAVICLLFVFTALLSIPAGVFGLSATPLSDLALVHFGSVGVTIFSLLVYLAIIGSVAGWIVSAPRLILSLSEDGLFIKQLAHISPKYQTPSLAIVFQTIFVLIFVVIGSLSESSYETLLKLLVPLVLLLYASIMFIVYLLRKKMPDHPRYYSAPVGTIGPFFLIVIFIGMIAFWAYHEHNAVNLLSLAGSFIAIGIPIYVLVELYNNSRFSQHVKDLTARYTLLFENAFIPKKIQQEILAYLGDIRGKKVLEYGPSVGTLSRHLIYAIGKGGELISINNSHTELKIVEKRLREPDWKSFERIKGSVQLIHHPTYHDGVPEDLPFVDAIVSLDTLSGLHHPKKIISELSRLVPLHARVCFFDFADFFRIIPNQHWLSNDEAIRQIFSESGFQVRVKRKKGIFWSYVFIYGVRSDEPLSMI